MCDYPKPNMRVSVAQEAKERGCHEGIPDAGTAEEQDPTCLTPAGAPFCCRYGMGAGTVTQERLYGAFTLLPYDGAESGHAS